MSDETEDDEPQKGGGKLGLIIGLALAIGLGSGAFYSVYSGMILGASEETVETKKPLKERVSDRVAFVPIDPIVISLGHNTQYKLRFQAQLEVQPQTSEEVAQLMPRILDVLNGYLRAVDVEDLRNPASLLKIRAQMLRRVKLVTGDDQVNDLLITEFVIT